MKEPLESALRSSSVSAKPRRVYALKFISGKYQGGEFALPAEGEIIVGRSSDQNMVLVEDMVSRRHARISVEGGDVFIRDLKSTNGTFVNGERISEAKLSEGDRVLIGTSIMKLVRSSESSPPRAKPKGQPEGVRRRASQVQRMTGSIEEVPLPDLLQLFSSSKKNGVLVVRTETDVGKLYLDAGQVVYATLNDDDTLGAEKSLYRIVGWTAGTFCLESQPEEEFPRQLKLSTEGLLMEAMRRMDEMARLDDELPAMDATLSLASPLVAELRDLEPQQLDVLQTALNHRVVEAILNHCPADDLSTCQALVELLKSGYLQEA